MLQAEVDGVRGKALVMLLAREALLLRRGDHLAIDDERGRGVVIERRNTKNSSHGTEVGRCGLGDLIRGIARMANVFCTKEIK